MLLTDQINLQFEMSHGILLYIPKPFITNVLQATEWKHWMHPITPRAGTSEVTRTVQHAPLQLDAKTSNIL